VTLVELEPLPDSAVAKALFNEYPSGVATIGATVDGEDVLMLVSSFTVGVSYEPAMCSVAIQRSSTTWPLLTDAPRLGVSVLSDAHSKSFHRLASRDTRSRSRDVALAHSASGALFLNDAVAWYDCTVVREIDAGDHVIVLLEVVAGSISPERAPLIIHRGLAHRTVHLPATA
jgi:flavin reductase (DIM6/NTAB) family NADH-FMN oxidoreductase RutF